MKKWSIIAIFAMACFCFSGCQSESRKQVIESSDVFSSSVEVTKTSDAEVVEAWKEIDNLPMTSKDDMVRYYQDYMKNVYPDIGISSEREECIRAFREDHPMEYDGMQKALPIFLEDIEENVIIYKKSDGNIYYFDNMEKRA